jgi:hypothetical protein
MRCTTRHIVLMKMHQLFWSIQTSSWQHKKTPFLLKCHNSAKNHSSGKPVLYAQVLELHINPVKTQWNCISGKRGVFQTNFINTFLLKDHNSAKNNKCASNMCIAFALHLDFFVFVNTVRCHHYFSLCLSKSGIFSNISVWSCCLVVYSSIFFFFFPCLYFEDERHDANQKNTSKYNKFRRAKLSKIIRQSPWLRQINQKVYVCQFTRDNKLHKYIQVKILFLFDNYLSKEDSGKIEANPQ